MTYCYVHMRHLDHHMMMCRSRLDENLVLFLYAWNLVEYNDIIADLVEIVNTNVTRKSSRANTKISNRSRLDYNTNKTRSQHEDLDDFLCPDF